MSEPSDQDLFNALRSSDNQAFELIYDRFHERTRLVTWRISHRPDWIDELHHDAWCRAYRMRTTYNPERPFLVWFAGIVRNAYREHCRQSLRTLEETDPDNSSIDQGRIDQLSPENIAAEVELLASLNDCMRRLDETAQRIVRLRFFEEMTLREVAQAIGIPESTLREHRLPTIFSDLRTCLTKKGVDFSQISPAQLGAVLQYPHEEPE